MAYSIDFKKLTLKYRRSGHTVKEVCELSGTAPSTLYEWEKEELKKAIEKKPDSYLRELAKPFDCSPQAVQQALSTMKITLKKRPSPTRKNPKKNGKHS